MIIQHNIMALNSYNRLGTNNNAVQKNLEKLSSGYRINRAGDDAAGLAISEKMRAQITGLERAQLNAKDGISLVQTAEGALTEVHSMLNRLVELGVESANGIYQADDRNKIQAEVEQITEEIDRISAGTNFNGIKLLDGSLGEDVATVQEKVTADLSALVDTPLGGVKTIEATKGQFYAAPITALTGLATTSEGDKYTFSFEYTDNDGKHQKTDIEFELALPSGATGPYGNAAGDLCLKTANGTEYKVAAKDGVTTAEFANAIISELKKDETFSANFDVKVDGTTAGQFDFTAVVAGKDGASIDKLTQTKTAKADGKITHTAQQVTVGLHDKTANGVSTAENAFKTIDLAKATVWDGKKDTLEDAIFEINGKKFVFIDNGVTVSDELQTWLNDAGVGNNHVKLAAAGNPAAADVTKMVAKIKEETGLNAIQGDTTTTAGEWTSNTTGTEVALKDNVIDVPVDGEDSGARGLTLQVGDTNEDFNKVTVYVDDMSSKGLGIDNLDVTDQGISGESIDRVKAAIEKVSVNRGRLGALQNRLEHTLNNLATTTENMTNAESRIRDTDMAQEMMAFTKNNVLVQAAQSMLAQANQQPQQVLQLLR